MEKRPDDDPARRRDPEEFFGLDVERMSPRAQLTTALAVMVPVALAGIFLFAFTQVWWIWFTFFWVIFPAFGLLVRGIAGLSEERPRGPSAVSGKERELLEALRGHGELTPAQAAMETSLTVAEADGMLKELAEGGHLQVRVRGGGLFYSLWEVESGSEMGRLEDR
ncbi:MAG TPA: hypothetical protein VK869_01265 [Rubrobacteraceae bacterium]|nr:hypothetical protein [Rubrobacteraceae bacterium]